MSSFIQDCLRGDADLEDIDDYVDAWHDGPSTESLHEFLGMTETEYRVWVSRPNDLAFIVSAHKQGTPIFAILQQYQEQPFPMAARSESRDRVLALKSWLEGQGLWSQ